MEITSFETKATVIEFSGELNDFIILVEDNKNYYSNIKIIDNEKPVNKYNFPQIKLRE